MTLRDLLIQRAARLQDRPAFTVAPWGELSFPRFRNRVEGVAMGLILSRGTAFQCATGGPWDWICEVACGCCGFQWETGAAAPDPELLGGTRFNDEEGRQAYHDCGDQVVEASLFTSGLSQGELVRRLQRLNVKLGWDHDTVVPIPEKRLGEPEARAALWSCLYGGSHAVVSQDGGGKWDPAPFGGFWD